MASHRQISKKGGDNTLKKYGRDFYVGIGRKGADALLKKRGPDYFKKLSEAGLKARMAKRELMKNKITS